MLKEKRDECMSKLERGTCRLYLQEFLSIYDNVKKANKKSSLLLKEYQYAIRGISQWTVDDIKLEHAKFNNHCDLFDSLVKSIFKLHLSIYNTMHESDFDANIPHPGQYMHETYLSIARRLWKEPFLVYDLKIDKMTQQKNLLRLEKIIRKCLHETFLIMLPFKEFDAELAKKSEDECEEEEEEEEEYEIVAQPEIFDSQESQENEEEEETCELEDEQQESEVQEEHQDCELHEEYEMNQQTQSEDEEENNDDSAFEEEEEKVVNIPEENKVVSISESADSMEIIKEDMDEIVANEVLEQDPTVKVVTLPVRKTLADRKRMVKEKVKQRGFPDFARPADSFF